MSNTSVLGRVCDANGEVEMKRRAVNDPRSAFDNSSSLSLVVVAFEAKFSLFN